jgi:predicted RNase H-like HicB family nuclease
MTRVQLSSIALMLAASTFAWADGGSYPAPYAGSADVAGKTRAQVIAELQEAQRLGLMTRVDGDFVSLHVTESAGETVVDQRASRTQVRAETQEAARLGLLRNDEGGSLVATPRQQEMIAAAGHRAM